MVTHALKIVINCWFDRVVWIERNGMDGGMFLDVAVIVTR